MPVEDHQGIARLGMRIEALGQEDVAPRCMGRPQNFVSRSLWIRSCLMYLVVAGLGDRRDHLVEPDADRRRPDSHRARS